MTRIALNLFAALIAVCAGCGGPTSTVQGTVTIDGEIARQGTVVFHPVEGGAKAYGSIADDGSYALRVGQGDLDDPNAGDVPPGEYIVTVVVNMPSSAEESLGEGDAGPPTPGARLSAEKYGTAETSGLKHTVKVGQNVIPLEIDGTSGQDAAASESASESGAAKPATEAPAEGIDSAPGEHASSTPETGEQSTPAANEQGQSAEEQAQ